MSLFPVDLNQQITVLIDFLVSKQQRWWHLAWLFVPKPERCRWLTVTYYWYYTTRVKVNTTTVDRVPEEEAGRQPVEALSRQWSCILLTL